MNKKWLFATAILFSISVLLIIGIIRSGREIEKSTAENEILRQSNAILTEQIETTEEETKKNLIEIKELTAENDELAQRNNELEVRIDKAIKELIAENDELAQRNNELGIKLEKAIEDVSIYRANKKILSEILKNYDNSSEERPEMEYMECKEISKTKLEELAKKETGVSEDDQWGADGQYYYVSLENWQKIIEIDDINFQEYKKDINDCDNFAYNFNAHVNERFALNGAGVATGIIKDAITGERYRDSETDKLVYHTWNCLIVEDTENPNNVSFYYLEPQDDQLTNASNPTFYNEVEERYEIYEALHIDWY